MNANNHRVASVANDSAECVERLVEYQGLYEQICDRRRRAIVRGQTVHEQFFGKRHNLNVLLFDNHLDGNEKTTMTPRTM